MRDQTERDGGVVLHRHKEIVQEVDGFELERRRRHGRRIGFVEGSNRHGVSALVLWCMEKGSIESRGSQLGKRRLFRS